MTVEQETRRTLSPLQDDISISEVTGTFPESLPVVFGDDHPLQKEPITKESFLSRQCRAKGSSLRGFSHYRCA